MVKLSPGGRVRSYLPRRCTTHLLPWGTRRTPLSRVTSNSTRIASNTMTSIFTLLEFHHNQAVAREILDMHPVAGGDLRLANNLPLIVAEDGNTEAHHPFLALLGNPDHGT